MDLGEILLILLFLVFPLLQQLLQRRSPSSPPGELEEGEEGEEGEEERPPMELEGRTERLPGHESRERVSRPAEAEEPRIEAAEALARREVLDAEGAAELTVLQSRLPAETVPEAVRVSSPVVSMESLWVHRPAKPPRAEARPAAAPPRPRPFPRIDTLLHGPGQLRRAIILSEVLGPPKGLE